MQQSKIIDGYEHISYQKETYPPETVLARSDQFYHWMDKRRTVRDFSDQKVPRSVIENILLTASTAPSGAHKQPWTFCVISDPKLKSEIRKAAEHEEYQGYSERMSEEWLEALKPIGTDWRKPFLEIAPYLIIVFKRIYEIDENGEKKQLLCKRIVRTRLWFFIKCYSSCRVSRFNPYPQSYEFFGQDPEKTRK